MDYKKTNAPLNTVTRDMMDLCKDTGNVYETVSIIAKRANQIAGEMKRDLDKKLQEFASLNDNLEEISENPNTVDLYASLVEITEQYASVLVAKSGQFELRHEEQKDAILRAVSGL